MADLISREAAIQIAERYGCNNGSALGHHSGAADCIASEIATLPAVDAVPVVHARPVWINPLNHEAKICTWKCSSLCSACGDYVAVGWKHCQNCGAKIVEE